MKKLVLVLFFAFFTLGCAMTTTNITMTDPSHLRVLLRNESPYRVKLEGAKTGWLGPRESITFNTSCAGKFNGVAHAYKVIGATDTGGDVSFYIGEQTYSFHTDGRNSMYYGESYDAVVVISSFHKHKNVLGEKTHYPFYTGPCGSIFLPDVKFEWGK